MAVQQIGIRISVDAQSGIAELPRLGREFENVGNAAEQASARATRSLGAINTSMRDLVGAGVAVSLVTKAVHELTNAITALPSGAFDFTKNLEVSQVGMAGILSSMTAINGKQLEYNQAVAISSGMIAKLNDDALRTAATSQELVTVFQALLAPGLAARMSLDEIRQLTVVGTNAVKSIGLGSHQVVQELRDLVAGGITAASSTLATSLGLKDSDIAKAKASSEGLFAFLMERMKGFQLASEAYSATIKGRLDQIKEGSIRVAADGFDPMIQAAKQALGEVSALFVTFKADGSAQLNTGLVNGLKDISDNAVQAAAATRDVVATVWEHRDAVVALAAGYAAIKTGQWAAAAMSVVTANIEVANASRLAAVQAAAQGVANVEVAATSRMKIAALLAELQVQQAAAQARVLEAAAHEATTAARVAELRAVVLSTQSNVVNAEVVRNGLVPALAAATAATVAKTEAERVASIAAAQLAAANQAVSLSAGAASLASRGFGVVVGALGGGVGVGIAAIAALGIWLYKLKGQADDAAEAVKAVGRAEMGLVKERTVRDKDVRNIQAQLEAALDKRDEIEGRAGNVAKNATAQARQAASLAATNAEISKYEVLLKDIAAANAKVGTSTAGLTLTLTGAEQAWKKANDGIKTSSAAQQEYETKLSASRLAWETYKSSLQASKADPKTIAARQAEQNQVEAALATERDKHIKQLGAGAATAQSHAMSAQIEAVKQGYKAIAAQTADGLDEIDSLRKQDLISEYTAVQRRTELKLKDIDAQKQALNSELSWARGKENAGVEQARLAGQLTELEQKRVSLQNKSARDLEELAVKPQLEQIAANYKTADSVHELAQRQDAANETLGKSKTAIEQVALATMQQQLREADSSDSFTPKYVASVQAKITAQEHYVKALQATEYKDLLRKEQDWLDQAKERVALYADEQQLAGLTGLERAKIVATRQIELRLAKELAEIDKANLSDTEKEALRLKASEAAQIDSAAAVNKVVQEDWQKTTDQINQSLTDAIMNGGKSGAENLKNLFKTMVLRPIISGVMSPIAGAVSSVVNSGLSAIGLGSSGVGTSALGSLVSSALGSITLGGSTIAAIGSSVATGVSAGLAGTSLAGASAAYGAAGMSGVASGLSVGSSIGTAMAAIPGWGWAAMGAAALSSVLGGKGDSRFGGRYSYDETNGAQYQQGPTHQDSASGVERVIVNATADYVNSTFKLLGSTQRLTGIDAGYESSEKGKGFSFAAGTVGGVAIGDQNSYNNNRGSKTAEQAFSEFQRELDQLKIQALQAAGDVPKIIADQLKSIDANSLSQEQAASVIAGVNAQITAVQGLQQSLNTMPFDSLKNLSFTAAAGLVAAAGGLEALNTKLSSYYENFYNSEEKRVNTLKNIGSAFATAGLGVTAEQLATMTRGQYRQLYEYVSKNWGESSSMAMSILGLSDQFANITPAADAAGQAVAGVSDALKKLQGDTANLQIELLRAQGNTAGADAAQYTIDTSGMTEAERAIFDYNRALRAQITALTEASAAAEKTNAAIRSNAKSAIESAVAAFEKSKSNTSDALAALEKSINAEKTRITVIRDVAAENVKAITGIFDTLKNQTAELYKSVTSSAAMQTDQGNDYINKALSTIQSTGYLPDPKDLTDAIAAARTGLGQDKFSSKFEADKASLVLAGKLTQLQTASGKQLTEAERQLQVSNDQLAALDKSLEMYKQQVDALNGINTSVLSVADAVSGLLGAMQAQSAAKAAVQAAQAQGAASLYASNPNAVKNPGQEGLDFWQGQIASKGYDATASTFDASVNYVNDTVKGWYAGNPDAVKNPDSGAVQYWLDQIDAMGADAAKAKFAGVVGSMTGNAARPVNSFSVGINRVPFDMTAEIHKDEAIVPAIYNPFNPSAITPGAGKSGTGASGDTSELLAEVRRLNARLERIEAHVASTSKNTERSALVLDDASRGKRPLKTEAAI